MGQVADCQPSKSTGAGLILAKKSTGAGLDYQEILDTALWYSWIEAIARPLHLRHSCSALHRAENAASGRKLTAGRQPRSSPAAACTQLASLRSNAPNTTAAGIAPTTEALPFKCRMTLQRRSSRTQKRTPSLRSWTVGTATTCFSGCTIHRSRRRGSGVWHLATFITMLEEERTLYPRPTC